MLTALTLRNFKSWQEVRDMRFAPITGLFGTNSSGKSSILQFLLMLKQTVAADDRRTVLDFGDVNAPVNLGGFRDVVYDHDVSSPLRFSLAWRLRETLTPKDTYQNQTLLGGRDLRINVSVSQRDERLCVTKLMYDLGELNSGSFDTFGVSERTGDLGKYNLDPSEVVDGFRFVRNPGRAWPLPSPPMKFYGFPDEVYAYYQNGAFLADLQLAFVQEIERVHYLGPLREHPRRHYEFRGTTPSDMGPKGEAVVEAILASRDRGRYISTGRGRGKRKRTLEERIAFWLKRLGLIHSFEVRPIGKNGGLYEVTVKRTPQSAEALITDVGFGVSQVLPVLVLCYYAEEGSTILLEQPEIHLHPSVQMGLADVFVDAMKNRNIQIVIESHSEHLLNRLQTRVAEKAVASDDVSLYFCDAGAKGSTLKALELDHLGNIANWPTNFFGDRFGEVAARREASLLQQVDGA